MSGHLPQHPAICGREREIRELMQRPAQLWTSSSAGELTDLHSAFACALHMHQPTVPAGPDGALISHLQYMLDHSDEGDHHNAENTVSDEHSDSALYVYLIHTNKYRAIASH